MRRRPGSRPRTSPVVAFGLVALLLLVAPATVLAQSFLARYKAGVEAAERGDWEQVADHMGAAIGERPESASRLVAQFHFRPYLPHHYLGLALAELGDCAGALEAFERSEAQGVVQEVEEEHARLRRARDRCRGEVARTAALRARAEAAIRTAEERLAALEEPLEDPRLADWWRSGAAPPRLIRDQAEERLREAEQALDEDPERAQGLAERAARVAGRLGAQAAAERERGRQLREEALAALEAGRERARRALAAVPDLRPYPDRLARLVGRTETLLAEADRPEEAEVGELDRLAEELAEAAAVLARAAAPPPDELLSAAEAFVAGRYGRVLELLPADGLPGRRVAGGRARAHAHLLRAATLFALGRSGADFGAGEEGIGERGVGEAAIVGSRAAEGEAAVAGPEERAAAPANGAGTTGGESAASAAPAAAAERYRRAARRELEAALALAPTLEPPDRFHSPAFLAFLAEVRAVGNEGSDDGEPTSR